MAQHVYGSALQRILKNEEHAFPMLELLTIWKCPYRIKDVSAKLEEYNSVLPVDKKGFFVPNIPFAHSRIRIIEPLQRDRFDSLMQDNRYQAELKYV